MRLVAVALVDLERLTRFAIAGEADANALTRPPLRVFCGVLGLVFVPVALGLDRGGGGDGEAEVAEPVRAFGRGARAVPAHAAFPLRLRVLRLRTVRLMERGDEAVSHTVRVVV
jgi:hypothetical protein